MHRGVRRRRESGQGLAELAIALPFLLILIVGVIECVFAFNHYISVTNAARDGARLGSKDSITDDEIRSLISNDMSRLPNGIDVDDDVLINRSPVSGEDAISVTACYDHEPIMKVAAIMDDDYRMCSTTIMKMIPTPEAGP
jgi:Flp pilus assembly protein TadG